MRQIVVAVNSNVCGGVIAKAHLTTAGRNKYDRMEYTTAELRALYRSSPAKVFEKLKPGDHISGDDDALPESLRILSICKIAYQLNTDTASGRNLNEIIIS